jgi:hypothetical protein
MKEEKILSLAEELGMVIEEMEGAEKEDFIQSYIFLIRERGLEGVEEVDWEVTSTSVASAKISILIDYLLDLNLLEYSSNPGYILTREGRSVLLRDIPEDIREDYRKRCQEIATIGDGAQIVKTARQKYLAKK